MRLFHEDELFSLYQGDSKEVLKAIPDASVDAIVTDPPYELGFMGKGWDKSGIAYNVDLWRECLRVLKPGGHLLAFSGSRTYHRMTCAIEDAGFEIRDQIMWIHSQGFPKNLDVSKAIDKLAGAKRPDAMSGGHRGIAAEDTQCDAYKSVKDAIGHGVGCGAASRGTPVTDSARQWQGWGTALKPAHEPICMARKPLGSTVAENVLAHGTGVLNIDGCRVALNGDYKCKANGRPSQTGLSDNYDPASANKPDTVGRWPANFVHDGSDAVLAGFPDSSGSGKARVLKRSAKPGQDGWGMNKNSGDYAVLPDAGTGSAARFFYCAKANKRERDEGCEAMRKPSGTDTGAHNNHPTVKPVALMRWLVRLVTPPGGVVLDPFVGSGTTGKAAVLEGFRFIGIDKDEDENGEPLGYLDIAKARIEHAARMVRVDCAKED